MTTHAVNRLHYMKDHPEKKVMTSIGFKSPHSPMRVPAKYYMPYLEPDRAAATPWARANASHLTFPEVQNTVVLSVLNTRCQTS